MNAKYFIIVSLMLAIITVGAVSASDDIMSDNNQASEDVIVDSIAEVDDSSQTEDDTILTEDNDDAILTEDDDDEYDVYCYIHNVDLSDEADTDVVEFRSYGSPTGYLDVYVDN